MGRFLSQTQAPADKQALFASGKIILFEVLIYNATKDPFVVQLRGADLCDWSSVSSKNLGSDLQLTSFSIFKWTNAKVFFFLLWLNRWREMNFSDM